MTESNQSELAPQLAEIKKQLAAAPRGSGAAKAEAFQPTPLEKQIFASTASALTEWRKSPEGQQGLANLRGQSAAEIQHFLHTLIAGPRFTQTMALVKRHQALPISEISFQINAVSVGLDASLVLIIGVQGSFGVAVNPHDLSDFSQDVIYLTGSIEVGIDEGGMAGVVVGFWKSAPVDLSGTSYGWEVEIDDFAGGYIEASYSNIDQTGFLGVSISEDEGEEDGAEGQASYTITWQTPAIYQPPAANYMIINSITCNKASETGSDEVYFYFTIDGGTRYRYPTQGEFSMSDDDSWNAGRSINFNSSVKVELFDQDDTSSDDSLGSYTYYPSGFPTSQQVSGSGGKYTLYAVLNPVWRAYS